MSQSFSLPTHRYDSTDDPTLLADIRSHTGSDAAAAGILRSIDRFGQDASIARWEITAKVRSRATQNPDSMAWTVRAIRG